MRYFLWKVGVMFWIILIALFLAWLLPRIL